MQLRRKAEFFCASKAFFNRAYPIFCFVDGEEKAGSSCIRIWFGVCFSG
jgi:hypothetical protein